MDGGATQNLSMSRAPPRRARAPHPAPRRRYRSCRRWCTALLTRATSMVPNRSRPTTVAPPPPSRSPRLLHTHHSDRPRAAKLPRFKPTRFGRRSARRGLANSAWDRRQRCSPRWAHRTVRSQHIPMRFRLSNPRGHRLDVAPRWWGDSPPRCCSSSAPPHSWDGQSSRRWRQTRRRCVSPMRWPRAPTPLEWRLGPPCLPRTTSSTSPMCEVPSVTRHWQS